MFVCYPVYDDSLILQQMEPPVFSSDKTPERPPVGSGNRRRSKPKNKKVSASSTDETSRCGKVSLRSVGNWSVVMVTRASS